MKVVETSVSIRQSGNETAGDLIATLGTAANHHVGQGRQVVRFVVTGREGGDFSCELGVFEAPAPATTPDLFAFRPRSGRDDREFNAVFLVPTGIGAEIGGHSGDSGPVGKLLAAACDHLITHPNVGNAADINELPPNTFYVEGSVIADLLMGNVELQPVRANRLILLMERHTDPWFMDATVNMASAARAAAGFDVREVVVLEKNFTMRSEYASSGRAAGVVEGLESVFSALDRRRGEFDAVAVASLIKVPPHYHKDYFDDTEDRMVNPWGGVEAMLTHTLSRQYRVPTAHAPMMTSREVQTLDFGPVDPRKAAEPVSCTYLFSVLKGLHRSPTIRAAGENPGAAGRFGAENIHCLVIPDGCIGLPTLAALAQRIPIVAVRGNRNCLINDLSQIPGAREGIHYVDNYFEAAGVMTALRNGISLESVRRPIAATKLSHEAGD
jgi:hypothetical protein